MIGIIIWFGGGRFESAVFRAIGIDELSLEMGDHEKWLGAESHAQLDGEQLGKLGRVAISLDSKLRHAEAAPRRDSWNRQPSAVRRCQYDWQHASPDGEEMRRFFICLGPHLRWQI